MVKLAQFYLCRSHCILFHHFHYFFIIYFSNLKTNCFICTDIDVRMRDWKRKYYYEKQHLESQLLQQKQQKQFDQQQQEQQQRINRNFFGQNFDLDNEDNDQSLQGEFSGISPPLSLLR
jgi:hypothetical protein